MKPYLSYLIICFFIIQLDCLAQEQEAEIKISDFALSSSYYQNNTTLKLHIYKYIEGTGEPIRTMLTQECMVTKQVVYPMNESFKDISSELNTMGTLTYCITGITKSGDIEYRQTYSGNLHITIDTGTLKR